jgi:DHA1 family bicyclomycin/chloramphenicol resistance-like MFS transporter
MDHIYCLFFQLGQLIWGPLSDKYGRLPVLFSTLFIFEALTIGIIFIGNIIDLIVLRTIEGLFVGSCIVSVQAIIADVFAPEERGAAMSYFLGPMLIGPIIAPLIGNKFSK